MPVIPRDGPVEIAMSNPITVSNPPPIIKLVGASNYGSWKFAMEHSLKLEGLYKYVKAAVDLTAAEDQEKDERALSRICLSVMENCYVHLRKAKTAREGWVKLQEAYAANNMATMFETARCLYNVRQDNFSSMDEYLTYILNIVQRLADMGEEVGDKWIAFAMMNGVSSEYESFTSTLSQMKPGELSEKVPIMVNRTMPHLLSSITSRRGQISSNRGINSNQRLINQRKQDALTAGILHTSSAPVQS